MIKYCDIHPRRLATHDREDTYASRPGSRVSMCPECARDEMGRPLPGTMSLRITVPGFDGALVIHVPEGHGLAGNIKAHGLKRAVVSWIMVEEIQ